MTLLSVGGDRTSPSRAASRMLHALPLTALLIDLAVMVGVGLIAIVGRRELDIFR